MSRKSLLSLRLEPEICVQSGEKNVVFVAIATELLKPGMSSTMWILVLIATDILPLGGGGERGEYALQSFCP